MVVKMMAALAVTAFAMLAGRAIGARAMRAADTLRLLMDELQTLRVLTLEKLMPMSAALMEMKFPPLRMTGELMCKGGALLPAAAWTQVEQRERVPDGALEDMSAEDAAEVTNLFDALTTLSRREHEERYAQTIVRLGRREETLRAAGRDKVKLYTSLGALAGLAVSVMLI